MASPSPHSNGVDASIDTKPGKGDQERSLNRIIENLLGRGFGYQEWKRELKSRGGYTWSETVKNTVIKAEITFFKDEILKLQAEPNKSRGLQSKTNSLESILKRLQGLEWGNGMPNEMDVRKCEGRLLGKDIKPRCLQYHVARWKNNDGPVFKPSSMKSSIVKDARKESDSSDQTLMLSPALKPEVSTSSRATSSRETSSLPSLFAQGVPVPSCDPTLHGCTEIPWLPLQCGRDVEAHGTDLSHEEVFNFIDHGLNFTGTTVNREFDFEIPRGDGTNDSYSKFIHGTTRDRTTQMKLLDEILESYGPLPDDNTMLWDADWTLADQAYEVEGSSESFSTAVESSFNDSCISPQDLIQRRDQTRVNTEQDLWARQHISAIESNINRPYKPLFKPKPRSMERAATSLRPHDLGTSDAECPQIDHNHKKSLTGVQLELRTKKDALVIAEARVLALRTEIKALEAAANNMQEHDHESTLHTIKHKSSEVDTTQRTKRLKRRNTNPISSQPPLVNSTGPCRLSGNSRQLSLSPEYAARCLGAPQWRPGLVDNSRQHRLMVS